VSEFVREQLITLGFDRDSTITNYLGIDVAKFRARSGVKRQRKIVCIARHVKYKGHKYLIEAMAKVNAIFPKVKLVIVGTVPLTESLKQAASQLQINCMFTVRLTSDEVQTELETAMVYCQPSIAMDNRHEEALALNIVEAQSMGVSAVVFNSGGMSEALIENESGHVVEQRYTSELAVKIVDLFTDKEGGRTLVKTQENRW
jgi:colanic acid/amylovoran biosynthesis glycosyltransferase